MKALIDSIKHNSGTFPKNELLQIIEHKDEAIPHLLHIVEEVKSNPDSFINDPARIDFLYAIYLLAQFRVEALYPLLMDIMSLPGNKQEEILGDTLTEGTGRMLASASNICSFLDYCTKC